MNANKRILLLASLFFSIARLQHWLKPLWIRCWRS